MATHEQLPQDFLIHRIVSLLSRTSFDLPEIARRTGCDVPFVAAVNWKYEVRDEKRTQGCDGNPSQTGTER